MESLYELNNILLDEQILSNKLDSPCEIQIYYLDGTSAETSISEFDYIVQLDIINIDNYLSEIYSLKLNSIIKFNSYNIINKMQKNQQNVDLSIREIIKLLEANPNNNLNKIINKLIN